MTTLDGRSAGMRGLGGGCCGSGGDVGGGGGGGEGGTGGGTGGGAMFQQSSHPARFNPLPSLPSQVMTPSSAILPCGESSPQWLKPLTTSKVPPRLGSQFADTSQ